MLLLRLALVFGFWFCWLWVSASALVLALAVGVWMLYECEYEVAWKYNLETLNSKPTAGASTSANISTSISLASIK